MSKTQLAALVAGALVIGIVAGSIYVSRGNQDTTGASPIGVGPIGPDGSRVLGDGDHPTGDIGN